ncbi:hypothetical protein [Pantoea stewartii]|uniref:Uncharacterized protein n=1 Tax=Pantoea stewartii subsp. stewartii DC283 TaxID=660596 RepID=H3RA28_PANSE|nr:hypothetical protein [Pantoea stewartii]ARF51487.1 hypothetical protein DSJ_20655 [Pantoea stewartii subsp. stewartii DC283]EHU02041.1 hypothetical protein CKS_0537 [Pantoea stewartii subsp. stewartii DC283]KAB0559718.1 hypothetical protein F7Q90_01155 [Pantoea stewartii subsp. stewartii]
MDKSTLADNAQPQNEPHLSGVRQLDETRQAFEQAWQILTEAEKTLHNFEASRDRAKSKSAEASRQWEAAMTAGKGIVTEEAEALENVIAQAERQVERLGPMIEAQALEVLDYRVSASRAAHAHHHTHRQLVGLYQLAGLPEREAVDMLTRTFSAFARGDHQALALAAVEQNADASPALAAFPGRLPFEVTKAIRHVPSPIQQSMMEKNPRTQTPPCAGP